MSIYFILVLMIFMHIVDDFYLQGILARMKQKSWWKENAPDRKYRYDYIAALIMHALSWSTLITMPIFWSSAFNPHWWIYLVMLFNALIHIVVDDLKANKKRINLLIDQSIHLLQVVITWALFAFI